MDRRRTLEAVRTHGPAVALELAVNVLLPVAVYGYFAPSLGDVWALLLSSLPPVAWSLVEFARHRRLDVISLLVLSGIALSLLAFFGGGGARMLQLREKLPSGLIGLAFLASAAVHRPVIYELARAGMKRRGSVELARFEALRDDPLLRRSMTIMTLAWGFALVLDVGLGVLLIFSLTIKQYLIVGPVEGYAVLGSMALWTFWYGQRSRLRNEALRAAASHVTR